MYVCSGFFLIVLRRAARRRLGPRVWDSSEKKLFFSEVTSEEFSNWRPKTVWRCVKKVRKARVSMKLCSVKLSLEVSVWKLPDVRLRPLWMPGRRTFVKTETDFLLASSFLNQKTVSVNFKTTKRGVTNAAT